MAQVFISYARHDKTFAEHLARDLQDAGLDIWIDFRQIKGGEAWREAIFRGVSLSDFMVVCLSPQAVQSEWVRREILMAHSQHKQVVPVMVRECFDALGDYEETRQLQDIQIVDFAQASYEQAFPRLLEALPGLRVGEQPPDEAIDPATIPNPFKGLEAFQQTDADVFFGQRACQVGCDDRIIGVRRSQFSRQRDPKC